MSKHRILSALKRDEIKEQDNTSHEASSTVERNLSEYLQARRIRKKGIEGEAYDNGNYVRERRQAL